MFRKGGESRGYVELDDVVDSEYISNAHSTHSGFEDDTKGTFLFRALGVIISLWIGLIIMLIVELYKLGVDKKQIKRLNVLFVWVWHVSLLLLMALRVFSSSIRNFFRLRAPMSRVSGTANTAADHVQRNDDGDGYRQRRFAFGSAMILLH